MIGSLNTWVFALWAGAAAASLIISSNEQDACSRNPRRLSMALLRNTGKTGVRHVSDTSLADSVPPALDVRALRRGLDPVVRHQRDEAVVVGQPRDGVDVLVVT